MTPKCCLQIKETEADHSGQAEPNEDKWARNGDRRCPKSEAMQSSAKVGKNADECDLAKGPRLEAHTEVIYTGF
jgi:hypothetical protein